MTTAVKPPVKHVMRLRTVANETEEVATWEPTDGAQARVLFQRYSDQGWAFFAIDSASGASTKLHAFDPKVEVMEGMPAITGG